MKNFLTNEWLNIASSLAVILSTALMLAAVEWWKHRALRFERRARILTALIRTGTILDAMLRGNRFIVSHPPVGISIKEAQEEIDRVFSMMQPHDAATVTVGDDMTVN